jgi:exopolyphosphatase/guanosine-5'-triphosphate,3'-diphosphate pyrophosphatase
VAHIARYHRRSIPRSAHLEYMALPRESRMVINKLASLLRVADALDRGHNQQVRDIQIERPGDEVIIYVAGVSDLALERLALAGKADLLEDTYGLTVRLEEAVAPTAPARRAEPIQ